MAKEFKKISFVIEDDYAKTIYPILKESYFVKHQHTPQACNENISIEFSYDDNILRIVEHINGNGVSWVYELLGFVIDYNTFYWMEACGEDGVAHYYDVCDDEAKYFVRPPKTEYELAKEEKIRKMKESEPFYTLI